MARGYNNDTSGNCVRRRSGPEGRGRTRHVDPERHGEVDAQRVVALRTVPAADQTDHRTSGSQLPGEPQTLGALVAHVLGGVAAAAKRSQVFDRASAEVRG